MTTVRRYWLLQYLGWGAYSIIGIFATAQYVGLKRSMLVGYLCFFAYSIGFTDFFRQQIKRRRWLELSVVPRLLRLAGCVLLIGALQTVLVIGIDVGFNRAWWPPSVLGLWLGVTNASLVWTFLYVQLTAGRRQKDREVKMDLALREAELRVLESQINPHFLFNCLNSIRALVIADPPRAQDMLTRLANVLRHSLRRDMEHTIPLATEVEAVSDYLALEAVRFEERMRVRVTIDPTVEKCRVPPMLLQTLVENAVKHGIAQVADYGDLVVRVTQDGGSVRLEVENTGQLSDGSTNGTQLGLANTRERLRLIYGDRATLSLRGNLTTVTATVVIPA